MAKSKHYQNDQGIIVELLENTATNKYGDKLLWVRTLNGHETSIWEKDFIRDFSCGCLATNIFDSLKAGA